MSTKDLVKKQVALFNHEHLNNKEIIHNQTLISEKYLKEQEETQEEIRLWKKFQEIVLASREENNKVDRRTYFSFDYVDQLEVEYDLLLVYGGKNIGKTYSMSTLMKKIKKKDPFATFMILRNTREEVEQGLKIQLLEGNEGPFTIKGSSLALVTKNSEGDEEITNKKKRKKGGEIPKEHYGGYATCLTGGGLKARQGASYENLRLVGWDECNDTGDRGIFKDDTFSRLLIFLLSMERNNTEKLKVIMTGNLLRYSSGVVGNMILDKLNIPYDAKLKYITRETDKIKLRILYINTGQAGELFDGVNSQKFSQLFGSEAISDLESNQPESESSKVLNVAFFTKGDPVFSFVFIYKEAKGILYLSRYVVRGDTSRISTYYILHIEKFNKGFIHKGFKPYSDTRSITNSYGIVSNMSNYRIAKNVRTIFKIMESRKLFYSCDIVRERGEYEIEEYLASKYEPILKDGI